MSDFSEGRLIYFSAYSLFPSIENSKNVYPDVIKKELPKFLNQFKDIINEEKQIGVSWNYSNEKKDDVIDRTTKEIPKHDNYQDLDQNKLINKYMDILNPNKVPVDDGNISHEKVDFNLDLNNNDDDDKDYFFD